jgi:hypothetical protein
VSTVKKSQAKMESALRVQEGAPRLPVAVRGRRQAGIGEHVTDKRGRDGDAELAQLADDPQ